MINFKIYVIIIIIILVKKQKEKQRKFVYSAICWCCGEFDEEGAAPPRPPLETRPESPPRFLPNPTTLKKWGTLRIHPPSQHFPTTTLSQTRHLRFPPPNLRQNLLIPPRHLRPRPRHQIRSPLRPLRRQQSPHSLLQIKPRPTLIPGP